MVPSDKGQVWISPARAAGFRMILVLIQHDRTSCYDGLARRIDLNIRLRDFDHIVAYFQFDGITLSVEADRAVARL